MYEFDDCQLDVARVVLRRSGEAVPVEPQVFDLLRCLIERRGQVVRKEEILDEVWGDRFVSESALTSRVKSARRAVGDDGTRQGVIRTVHGRGYEFVATVREIDGTATDTSTDGPPGGEPRPDGAVPAVRHQFLPLAVQALIGRDELLDRLAEDVDEARLVTLVGPAGVGKTTAAFELARRAAGDRRDGVFVVELVTVGDGDAALAAVATALDVNVRQQTSIETAIIDMLRSRRALLLLDNCEHLIESVARLAEQIVLTAPGVTIVATSREPLAVPGERVHVVEPLPVVGLDDVPFEELSTVPAVALFVERARAADSRFELTTANADAVVEICRRLDGIPLALELAAARTHTIDVHDLARRLDERLRLLKGVRRGADPRHSTLGDAISWSYDLLDDEEQQLFAKLSVFAGAFDLEAAEAVCEGDDVLDMLTRLSQRSMLAVRRQSGGGTRYEMLEILREFAHNRLDDLGNVSLFSAHARHFTVLAERVAAVLGTPDELAGMRQVDAAFADLRAAQRFAVEVGDVDTALRLITSIREYAMRSLRYEALTWADAAAAELPDETHPLRPTLTAVRAYGAFVRGEFDTAVRLADLASADEQAQSLPPSGLAERARANALYSVGDAEAGLAQNALLVELAQGIGDPSMRAHANYMCSVAESSMGDAERGRRLAEVAFDAAHESGSPTDLASAWMATGFASWDDDEAALDAFASADRLARSAGNRWMSAFARTEASGLRVAHGDLATGCAGLAETVDAWYRAGEWGQQWLTLSRCVIALDRIGRADRAAEVYGAVEAHATIDAPPVIPSVRDITLATRHHLEEELGHDRVEELLAVGARLPVATIVHRTRSALLGLPDDD